MAQPIKKGGLLKKWINGTIHAKEEAQLDNWSAKDPFLKEALEGYRDFAENDHQKSLEQLRSKIKPKRKEAQLIPLNVRRIAAAIAFLLIAGTVIWLQFPQGETQLSIKEEQSPTQNEENIKEDIPEAIPTPETPTKIDENKTAINKDRIPIPAPKRQIPSNPPVATIEEESDAAFEDVELEESSIESIAIIEPEPARAKARSQEKPAIIPNPPIETAQKESLQKAEIEERAGAIAQNDSQENTVNTFIGRITDLEGRPIPGAIIQDQSGSINAISDRQGSFNFVKMDQISLDNNLQVKHFNYLDTNFLINNNLNNISLNLKEPPANTNYRSYQGSFDQPYPEGGFNALSLYFNQESAPPLLENYSSKRKQKSKKSTQTFVTIAFTIYKNGTLDDFEIINKVKKKTSQKAIDILQNGPKWVVPNNLDSIRTQITVPVLN